MADIRFQACLTEFYQKAYNLLDMFAGLKITIGAGAAYSEVSSFSRSYKDATDALYYRILAGCGQILFWEKTAPVPHLSREEKEAYGLKVCSSRASNDSLTFIPHLFSLISA